MKNNIAFLVILLFISQSFSIELPEENNVLVLDDKTFAEAIKKHEKLLVEFYAPWCGHCKELAPQYEAAANRLRLLPEPIYLAKVDATKNAELSKKYEIEGFPTIKYFKNGEPTEYNGGRDSKAIIEWMIKVTGPPVRGLTSPESVEGFAKEFDVIVVFFGKSDDLYNRMFMDLAKAYDDLQFGECVFEECLKHYKVTQGSIVIFRNFDTKPAVIKPKYSEEELKQFIDQNTIPVISDFDERAAQLIFGKQVPGLFFYRSSGTPDEKYMHDLAKSIVDDLKGKIQIIYTDIQEGLQQRLGEFTGVSNSDLPTVRIHDTREEIKKYILEGVITKENILKFVQDWLDGKLIAHLKSEDESVTAQSTGPVVTLVSKNFKQYTDDITKHVLVEFYAPWCGNCQKLAPIYEDLAGKLKITNPNILVTKIDATANDIQGIELQSFPTLKLYKINEKATPVDFEGEKELHVLINFLQSNIKDFVRPDGIKNDL